MNPYSIIEEEIAMKEVQDINYIVKTLGYNLELNGAGYYKDQQKLIMYFMAGPDIMIPFRRGLEWLMEEINTHPLPSDIIKDVQEIFLKYATKRTYVA